MKWDLSVPLNPLQILLVEDDDGDARAVERAFQKARILNLIVRAIDGIDALEILRGQHHHKKIQKPYLLLVDVNMPRMGGIDLVAAVREDPELQSTTVFMLTTSNRDEDKQAAYAQHVTGYILKEKAGEDFLQLFSLIESYWRVVELP